MFRTSLSVLVSACFLMSVSALAADMTDAPYKYRDGVDLTSPQYANKTSLWDVMERVIKPAMFKMATPSGTFPDEGKELRAGKGYAVKIANGVYMYHVSYPKSEQGGRSFGAVEGQPVGDWSDAKYLRELTTIVRDGDDQQLAAFYQAQVQMIGKINNEAFDKMDTNTKQVSANFLAIYGAEQYRRMVKPNQWDDAIWQTSLVSALHGGQSKVYKFYNSDKFEEGRFSASAYSPFDCVYQKKAGNSKKVPASIGDYWQFGKTAQLKPNKSGKLSCTGRSGLNITRADFEAMGKWITSYEKNVAKDKNLAAIEKVVGSSSNVINALADYFIKKQANNPAVVDELADNVAAFLVKVRQDADAITAYTCKNAKNADCN